MCGCPEFDVGQLELITEYEGYDKDDDTIRYVHYIPTHNIIVLIISNTVSRDLL